MFILLPQHSKSPLYMLLGLGRNIFITMYYFYYIHCIPNLIESINAMRFNHRKFRCTLNNDILLDTFKM